MRVVVFTAILTGCAAGNRRLVISEIVAEKPCVVVSDGPGHNERLPGGIPRRSASDGGSQPHSTGRMFIGRSP